jgi:predicted Zn-dependent protease
VSEFPYEILEPFSGYLDLGMFLEAHDERERLPTQVKTHPAVLSARLELLMEMRRWEDAVILGHSLIKLWPVECDFYIRTAFCLHEMKRTEDARQLLLGGPDQLRTLAVYYYNLACYEAQLGNIPEAKRQLAVSTKMDARYKAESLDDPDLEPVWAGLET